MTEPVHPDVAQVGEVVGEYLNTIASLFKPGAKLTLLVRSPESVEGSRDLVLTNDTLPAAIAALTLRTPDATRGAETPTLPSHIDPIHRSRLQRWANRLRGRYGVPIYLCGSALREDNPDPRDWDVRIMLPDDDFAVRFGPAIEWVIEGNTGEWTRTRWRWSEQCVKDTKDFAAYVHLNGDVQIYPESHAETMYADQPRVRLDSYPDDAPATPSTGVDTLREHYAVIDDVLDKVICEQRADRRRRAHDASFLTVQRSNTAIDVIDAYLDVLEAARAALRAALRTP